MVHFRLRLLTHIKSTKLILYLVSISGHFNVNLQLVCWYQFYTNKTILYNSNMSHKAYYTSSIYYVVASNYFWGYFIRFVLPFYNILQCVPLNIFRSRLSQRTCTARHLVSSFWKCYQSGNQLAVTHATLPTLSNYVPLFEPLTCFRMVWVFDISRPHMFPPPPSSFRAISCFSPVPLMFSIFRKFICCKTFDCHQESRNVEKDWLW